MRTDDLELPPDSTTAFETAAGEQTGSVLEPYIYTQ